MDAVNSHAEQAAIFRIALSVPPRGRCVLGLLATEGWLSDCMPPLGVTARWPLKQSLEKRGMSRHSFPLEMGMERLVKKW